MVIRIYPDNPAEKAISQVVRILEGGGVIIYPTDSVYAFGCSIKSPQAIERMHSVANKDNYNFSIICSDLSQAAQYAKINDNVFKVMKRNLPGPFTFILKALGKVPDKFLAKKKSIGIRITKNPIAKAIVTELGYPLVTTSVREIDGQTEYTTDPSLINDHYGKLVDAIIDGGYGNAEPTTVVDFTDDEPEIIRKGLGELKH